MLHFAGPCTVGIVHRARHRERNYTARDLRGGQRGDYPPAPPFFRGRGSASNFRDSIGRARAATRNNRVVANARRSYPPTIAWWRSCAYRWRPTICRA
jgi:hypothetical protein